jgi:hypothetical protein
MNQVTSRVEDMFLRNFGWLSTDYMVLHPRKQNCSYITQDYGMKGTTNMFNLPTSRRVQKSSRAISRVNVEPKNQSFGDLLGLHHQGRCGEWQYVADIYTSLSNRCILVCCAVGGWSQTVWSPIRLWPLTVSLNLVSLLSKATWADLSEIQRK